MSKIHIVMSTSGDFLKYMSVSIWSLMTSSDRDTHYVVSVLYLDIDKEQIDECKNIFSVWGNLELDFICVKPYVDKYGVDLNKARALPTCYGLLSGELFPEEDRVISLDSDLIIKRDLTALWNTDMGDSIIAGVLDADFSGQYNSKNPKYLKYYTESCPLDDPGAYIQAGVVLYDLSAFREAFPNGEAFIAACGGTYKYDDQDVLNRLCSGRIMLLDMRWNLIHNNLSSRVPYVISLAPEEVKRQYNEARKEPWIIHYAGCEKPWNSAECDLGDEFWAVVKTSPIRPETLTSPDFGAKDLKKSAEQRVRKFARMLRFKLRKLKLSVSGR